MKVITKNFQILKGTVEWEFPVGLTIIQGPSGNGKTSFIYAVEYALTNPSGCDDVINWDAKQAEVTIENNGAKVKWIKTGSSSEYVNELTGQSYVKASKLDSRDIGDLGFYFDNKNRVINIHDEWCLLFPFGSSDAEMFKLFEDIFNVSSSFKIIEEIKDDEKSIKNQISEIDSDINAMKATNLEIESILNNLNEADVDVQLAQLEKALNNCTNLQQDYENYLKYYELKDINVEIFDNNTSLSLAQSHYSQLLDDYNDYVAGLNLCNVKLPDEKQFDLQVSDIFKDYNEYLSLFEDANKYQNELMKLASEEDDLNTKLSSIKICPTCGRPL